MKDEIKSHPKWLIEENAKIFRRRVWLKPPSDPNIAERIALVKIIHMLESKLVKIERGAIFCHVRRIIRGNQSRPSTIDGNHWWKGALPSFSTMAIEKMIDIMSVFSWGQNLIKEIEENIIENKKVSDPRVWIRKYLIILSDESLFL